MITLAEIDRITTKQSSRGNARISFIIIHDTDGSMPGCLEWLQIDRPHPVEDDVSAHLLIDKTGNIYRLVPDDRKAWHARGHNTESLGLELERDKDDETSDYPYDQLEIAACAVARWCLKFNIPLDHIYAHKELSGLRHDPRNFPWRDFLLRVATIIIEDSLSERSLT